MLAFGLLAAGGLAATPASILDATLSSERAEFRVRTFAFGLDHPWGIAFLPDGSALVTERPGRLRLVSGEGRLSAPVSGVPAVDARGQGGLLDVALDPDFATNRRVYLTYAEPGPDDTNSTAVARARLSADARSLSDLQVIFSQKPKIASILQFGSRLAFDAAGDLFVTLGERSLPEVRVQAQGLGSDLGKVIRLHPDGEIPVDNPFVRTEGALPEIWSYGHRNPESAAVNPRTGELWEIEHGPKGGDEINIVRPGKNYGWPIVSFGVNYDDTPVGDGRSAGEEFEPPIYQWTPVIAPSGMAFYTGAAFPAWQGNLFVGGLKTKCLVRLTLDGDRVVGEERLLRHFARRIRDVVQGPGGALYILTDETDGAILKLDKP